MFPLTGSGELNKDLAEERQRDLLEEAQADRIAEGDPAALIPENYQPVTDDEADLIDTREGNEHVGGSEAEPTDWGKRATPPRTVKD